MKNKIIQILKKYESEVFADGTTEFYIDCYNYNEIAEDIVNLFTTPDVSINKLAVCNACGCERTITLTKCGKCGNTLDIINTTNKQS
jgi:hypothetical protein